MPATSAPAPSHAPARPATTGLVALADRCVQCGLCLPHCPTYRLDRLEAESPRGRIAYARAVALGTIEPTAAGDRHLDHCLACRRCEPVCPAGVRYGDLLLAARADRAGRGHRAPRIRLALALLARPALLDRLLGFYRAAYRWLPRGWRPVPRPPRAGAAPPDPVASDGAAAAPTAIFVGCIARRYEAPTRAALQRLLAAAGISAVVPDDQGCCGAAAAHAGDAAGAAALAGANRAAFAGGRVLCLATGCHDTLARTFGADAVDDPLAVLDRAGAALRFRPASGRVALHLPCTQRSVVGSGPALRRLLARIPGIDLVELPDTGCCGAAGLHQLEEPARAAAFRAPLLEALAASGATQLLSANIGCRLHLADGTTLPVRHPIDFLAEHLA